MTAHDVLAEVLRAGGRVVHDIARPRLMVPPALKPLVLEHREALGALVLAEAAREAASLNPPPTLAVSGALRRLSYAFPWPDTVPGLGCPHHRRVWALRWMRARLLGSVRSRRTLSRMCGARL